jgi:hypothetical protein
VSGAVSASRPSRFSNSIPSPPPTFQLRAESSDPPFRKDVGHSQPRRIPPALDPDAAHGWRLSTDQRPTRARRQSRCASSLPSYREMRESANRRAHNRTLRAGNRIGRVLSCMISIPHGREIPMAKCEVSRNDYDKAFHVVQGRTIATRFDRLSECAIHALAARRQHCRCQSHRTGGVRR